MNRRRFLKAVSQSTVSLACIPYARSFAAESGPSQIKSPVVDAHMHVWINDPGRFPFAHPYQRDYQPPDAPGTVDVLLADMDANAVTHAVLVQTICHGWDNRYTAHCVRACPTRLRGHGLIDPVDPHVADKLSYWMSEQGLSGMRFSPIYYKGKDDWMTSQAHVRLWKKATELGAIFNFFVATDQLPKLAMMIEQFPAVPVVIDHLSQIDLGAADPLPEMKKLLALARYPNVRVKVSELTSVSKSHEYPFADALPWVRMVYDAFGPSRLLWGTGYPGPARAFYKRPTLADELTLVREKIPFFTAEDQQKILGENAAAIWKLTA
ncbi:MAG TPA: amidohydrolase family protein [Pirellulales bacterium]